MSPIAPPPLSLYLHFPWCARKCPYCDFNSHALPDDAGATIAAYVDALLLDLERALPAIWGRRLVSLFIGGGTPSLLPPDQLDRLMDGLRARAPLRADAEMTIEANPGTTDAERFRRFRAAGLNRLSLGIQSFDDRHLVALGRIHDGDEARRAIAEARRHFDNVNLDLMYGLPGQTVDEALADLDTALSFAPTHLSCYQLTLEPNTPFAATPPALPADDLCADMQDAIEGRLAAAGYEHYETSAFARPGFRCRHNLNYWTFGDYLGLGAGAHGKLTRGNEIHRQVRPRSPRAYLDAARQVESGVAADFSQGAEPVAAETRAFEFLMNALRLIEGVPADYFAERCPLDDDLRRLAQTRIDELRGEGLLVSAADRLAPTDRGRRFLNRVLERFL